MNSNSMATIVMDFPVLHVAAEKRPPAWINRISLTKRPDEQDLLRIEIARNLSVPIKSFIIRYRFSAVPVCAPDPKNQYHQYTYEFDDINTSPILEIPALIPSEIKVESCGAYISEIVLANGKRITFDSSEYCFILKAQKKAPVTRPAPQGAPGTAAPQNRQSGQAPNQRPGARTPAVPPKKPLTPAEAAALRKKKRTRLTVIFSALAISFVVEIIAGVYLYKYLGVKNSTDYLIEDGLYNEAYKLAEEANQKGVLQSVCEKAAVYYFGIGDLESAYVYAHAAPKPFTDMIIDNAAGSVIDITTGKINEYAFRVAKMAESNEKFAAIVRSTCDILTNKGDFTNALLVASEIRDDADREQTERDVFTKAMTSYVEDHRYREAAQFIDELGNVSTFNYTKEEIIQNAVDVCKTLGDNAGIIYLSQRYPESVGTNASKASIASDDPGVRSEFTLIYPLLSAHQRRSYHSQPIAVWNNEIVVIEDGIIEGTKITDAASVDTNETLTLVLHKSGKVSAYANDKQKMPYKIPSYEDVIDIALGEDHAVFLHEDGTVSAVGDNTYGQMDVSEWRDIVAVAAGQRFTLGLKLDGTVIAAGTNTCAQCDVSQYRNVVDIAACNQTAVMLFSDGTVMIQGYRSMGLSEVETVTGVKRIRAGSAAIAVELSDGSYRLFSGQISGTWGNPSNWNKMTAFDVGVTCIAGVDKIGVLLFDGDGLQN